MRWDYWGGREEAVWAHRVVMVREITKGFERVIHKPGDVPRNIEGCNLDNDVPCYETGLTDALVTKQHDFCAL